MSGAPAPEAMVSRVGDALDRRSGDTVVVLRRADGELRRLAGPAAAVWTACASPVPYRALVELAHEEVARTGADVVAAEVVADAVELLVGSGLIEVTG